MRRHRETLDPRWKALADYNAEVARGIVHTAEYDAKMATWQKLFDAEMAEKYASKPRYVPEKPDPTQWSW